jgi:hypothetical protein
LPLGELFTPEMLFGWRQVIRPGLLPTLLQGENNDNDIEDFFHKVATLNQEANKIERTQVTQGNDQSVKRKVYRQLKQLESCFNPDASKIVKDIEQGRDIVPDQANIALCSGNNQVEPTTLDQAWNHYMVYFKKKFTWMFLKV